MVNEGALLAARRNQKTVRMIDFEDSKDKVMMGMERKSLIISDEEKKSTAYHESGHVLVSKKIPGSDPVHKVTIIPRGRALGVTHFLPLDERHTYTRDYCLAVLAKMLGGRAADEIIGSQPTTGAGDDIEKATHLARKMVCDWGMSDKLGPLTFGKKGEEIFLGREIAQHRDYSEKTAQIIDDEVKDLVQEAHDKAMSILKDNIDTLHNLAEALLEREILDNEEIGKLIEGKKLPPLKKSKKAAAPAIGSGTRKKASARKKKSGAALAPQPAKSTGGEKPDGPGRF
jgi:cell division protease FtsH